MQRSYFVDLSLILVAIIWALNFTVIKVSLEQMDAFSFNGLRFIFAAVILCVALWQKGQKLRFKKEHWIPLFLLGLLGNLVYQMVFIIGIDLTLAANAAVMLGTIPIWVAVLSHFFTDEKLTRIKTLGALVAFSGVALIIAGGKNPISFGSTTFIGDVIVVISAIVWATYTILSKKYLKVYTPTQYSTLMAIIGVLTLTSVGVPSIVDIDWEALTWEAYVGVIYSGAFSVGLAYLIWNNGIIKIGAVRTAAYQNLVPVLGLIFGIILLNEELTLKQYIGAFLVISGIIISRR